LPPVRQNLHCGDHGLTPWTPVHHPGDQDPLPGTRVHHRAYQDLSQEAPRAMHCAKLSGVLS
jgi:hypothetical protein